MIAIIAPDAGLRQSLAFTLEVEGYRVDAFETWRRSHLSRQSCAGALIDEQILRDHAEARDYATNPDNRVIILSDGLSPVPGNERLRILTKPFGGADLMNFIRKIILP